MASTSRRTTIKNYTQLEEENDLEWEEWDGQSPFLNHCLAGSLAGLTEHTLLFPVDTVKTHMQSYCADCPYRTKSVNTNSPLGRAVGNSSRNKLQPQHGSANSFGMWRTMRHLIYNGHAPYVTMTSSGTLPRSAAAFPPTLNIPNTSPSFLRLWRGIQAITLGCIPAHALYFSSYEIIKHTFPEPINSTLAGAVSASLHDCIMTPIDTIKQRLQLGLYDGSMYTAIRTIFREEGYVGFYRSFPITLLGNVPYGMIMVTTNDFLKKSISSKRNNGPSLSGGTDLQACMIAGCGAGFVAGLSTTPLDRIKTRLQTQSLSLNNTRQAMPAANVVCEKSPHGGIKTCKVSKMVSFPHNAGEKVVRYDGWQEAFKSIVKEEGYVGLWRGWLPRVMTHTPAVAISWTTYEAAKNWLAINVEP